MALVPADQLTRVRESATRFARGFTPGQKAVTVAAVIAVIVGAVLFMSFAGKPTYAPLFTNLQPSDAASITSRLTSDKVPFQLADGGKTVMVPADDVDTERLSMAQAGLPADSSAGLSSALNSASITSSSIQQQAAYLQGLQTELEQTIDAIHGVSSSQVNVALPANQTFALTSNNPTGASVMVNLQPGQSLSTGEVQAIVHLVGSSVPGLDANDVTVADSNGNLLAGPGVQSGAVGADGQTAAYDNSVQSKVKSYLNSVLGPGNANVQVTATLDYDQVSTVTNSIVPGPDGNPTNFCSHTDTSNQTYTGAGAPPGGVAGAVTPPETSGNGTYQNNQTQTDCTTSTSKQTVTQAPGTLKDESVAVLVNSRALPRQVNLEALRTGIAAAAGVDQARGDRLAVTAMPFSTTAAQQAAQAANAATAASTRKSLLGTIRIGVLVLIIAGVLFLLWRSARRARTAESGATVLSPEALAALRMPELPVDDATAQLPALADAVEGSREAADVNGFVDSQPEDVAAMLRAWMDERRRTPVS